MGGDMEAALAFPTVSWEAVSTSTMSEACATTLESVRRRLESLPTTALHAVQHGRVLLSFGPVESVSYVASIRKSILALLFGKYVTNGTIDLNRTVAQIGLEEPDGLLPIEREARILDLITVRSGVYHPASNPGDSLEFAPPRGSNKPGTYFLYNNWDFNAAGAAFEVLTGQSIYHAFASDLAGPLELEDFKLSEQRLYGDLTKSKYPAYHFWLSTRDMARIGHLMLAQGRWRDQQLVPREWVSRVLQTTTRSTDMNPPSMVNLHLSYGYMWWLLEEPSASALAGAYTAWGFLGQYVLVVPKRRMVIAHKVKPSDDPGQKHVRWQQFLDVARQLAESSCK